jgi:hypothetical protein
MNTRSFALSALLAGIVIGFLGNLPILNLINCVLCVWVWLGGILAVFLYRRFEHGDATLSTSQGAGLGAISGFIGALVGVVVFALTSTISTPILNGLARSLQWEGELPFQTGGSGGIVGTALVFFVIDAVLYPLFGALGGMIAASLTKKSPASKPA